MLVMKSIGFVTSIKKKVKVSEYMPNSKYTKLWFYLGMDLYTMSVRNTLAVGQSNKFENQFLKYTIRKAVNTFFLDSISGLS